jgi:hypothetical protein
MGGKVTTIKIHKYNMGVAYTPPELGGSTHAVIRFPRREFIKDVLAPQLNKIKVTANIEIALEVEHPPFANVVSADVAIADYVRVSEGGFFLPRTASADMRLRNLLQTRLILPKVIEAIENKIRCDHIAKEILPLDRLSLLAHSHISIARQAGTILTAQTQIRENDKAVKKIRIASDTMLVQAPPSEQSKANANLEIQQNSKLTQTTNNKTIRALEIMTREKLKTLKSLISLLSNDRLFD